MKRSLPKLHFILKSRRAVQQVLTRWHSGTCPNLSSLSFQNLNGHSRLMETLMASWCIVSIELISPLFMRVSLPSCVIKSFVYVLTFAHHSSFIRLSQQYNTQ